MAIVTTQSFKTADGRTFTDLAAAEAHEQYLGNREVVEAYIAEVGAKAPQAGALRRHLPAFAAFAESYEKGSFDLAAFDAALKAEADAKKAEAAVPATPVTADAEDMAEATM